MVSIAGVPNVAYVGSKFASPGMTKLVAIQYGPDNIRVNSAQPGYIKTPMMVAATDETDGDIAAQVPFRRLAHPEEVANMVLFLASDEASYISGSEHAADGGSSRSRP